MYLLFFVVFWLYSGILSSAVQMKKITFILINTTGRFSNHAGKEICPEFWTLYLYGDSYSSEILIFSAAASFSMLSIVGECFSFTILCIVDFEIPERIDNWRTVIFFLYMMSPNNIFIMCFIIKAFCSFSYGSFFHKISGNIFYKNL